MNKKYIKNGKIYRTPIQFEKQVEVDEIEIDDNGQQITVKKLEKCVLFTNDQQLILANGYQIYVPSNQPVVIDVKKQRFSKYKVKQELEKLGLWQAVKQMITEQMYEDLLIADDFAFDDSSFISIYEVLKDEIPNIDQLLLNCMK